VRASHALVADNRGCGLAAVRDGDSTSTVGVIVETVAHETVGKRHNVGAVILAGVVETASAKAEGEEREVTRVCGRASWDGRRIWVSHLDLRRRRRVVGHGSRRRWLGSDRSR